MSIREEIKKTQRHKPININNYVSISLKIPLRTLVTIDKMVLEGYAMHRSDFIRKAIQYYIYYIRDKESEENV